MRTHRQYQEARSGSREEALSVILVIILSKPIDMFAFIITLALLAPLQALRYGSAVKFGRVGIRNAQLKMSSPVFEDPFQTPFHVDKSVVSSAHVETEQDNQLLSTVFALLPLMALILQPEPSVADAGQYGILAGRTASMLHPVTNFALFGTSVYSAYLGWQWRRLRGLGEEIKSLNSQLPLLATTKATFPLSETIKIISQEVQQLSADATDAAAARINLLKKDLKLLESAKELDSQYLELTQSRKSLQSANLKDKHHNTGSILLGAGVSVSILGAFNTYMRAGRLFPGPHLYAGMAITILWALAAALVPYMQKGSESARIAHISLNVINIALFAWQIPTGIEIMLKVWEKTSWP